ncbi:MAG: 3-phosphoshikimate 1-carboxyvinyltransferase [Armatimonadetes bacterium]|nr:3-phosphoshikimate 1-carboxyvinyltransferase [Armatimonadota bacterium]
MTDYLHVPALEIVPSGPLDATFVVPSSKSYTNRALLLAALAEGESRIRRPLHSDDTARMKEALAGFGVEVKEESGDFLVRGSGGKLNDASEPLHCGLSGTTIRFLTAFAALAEGETVLTGHPPLLRRPIAPLADVLEQLGAEIRYLGEPGYPPLAVTGPLRGGSATMDASKSSQFLTALLLVAPYARTPVSLEVSALASRPYVEMTIASMREFGVEVEQEDDRYTVSTQSYGAQDYEVEYDASSAAHLLALAATSQGQVTLENAAPQTLQADARFAEYLAEMGCRVDRDGSRLTVQGPETLRPIRRDLSDTPDMTTPLAVICAYAEGDSHLYNVELVRGHETDRLTATTTELRKLGVEVTEEQDGLKIRGGSRHGARIATYHDHRMAMSFAAAGLRTPGVVIEDPGCVTKTYPGFWNDLERAGVKLLPRN